MTTLDLARPPGRTAAAPPGHRWLMLAVLLGGQFMALIDAFVVNVAMPSIGADLHASGAALQLVVGGYSAAYAMLLITGARLGDLYGRRRMYLLGVVVFTAASLACGLAPDSGLLIFARCAQGAAAAVLVPQILSVIQMRFTGPARATALSGRGLAAGLPRQRPARRPGRGAGAPAGAGRPAPGAAHRRRPAPPGPARPGDRGTGRVPDRAAPGAGPRTGLAGLGVGLRRGGPAARRGLRRLRAGGRGPGR